MNNRESGFSTPFAMTVIISLSLLILAFAMLIAANERKINSYRNIILKRKEAEKLVKNIEENIQTLKEYPFDSLQEIEIRSVLETEAFHNLIIKDVSTGINKNFVPQKLLENEHIKKYIKLYDEKAFCNYGWINPKFSDDEFMKAIKEDFEKENLFPLVNSMPLFNVYYMPQEFIEGILEYFKINKAHEKSEEIISHISEPLTKDVLASILQVQISNPIFNCLGTKTSFWKIDFETDSYNVHTVFAAVPEKNDSFTIAKYILINKEFSYKGGKI